VSEPDRHLAWQAWDGSTHEEFELRWDNGGWTGQGTVRGPNISYAWRTGPDWRTRQFLLFRDLEEPDLWLATDGHGRWGEMNGAVRHDLDGCAAISLACSPSTVIIAVKGLDLAVGASTEVEAATIDVETLAVVPATHRYQRLGPHHWRLDVARFGFDTTFEVDADHLLLDAPGWFRRVLPGVEPGSTLSA
jgi:hypothetical protein